MRKRILSFILVISMLLSFMVALPITANAASSGTCGDNLRWTLDDNGTLTISGTGEMYDYDNDSKNSPFYSLRSKIKSIVLNNGVTTIGDSAFYGCTSLTHITIHESITTIGYENFANCTKLEIVVIPDSVTYIDNYAFWGCTGLRTLIVGKNVETIRLGAFAYLYNLETIYWNAENASIYWHSKVDNFSFADAGIYSAGVDVIFGENVSTIPTGIFSPEKTYFASDEHDPNIKSVTISSSVKSIGSHAFRQVRSIENVYIQDVYSWMNVTINSNPLSVAKNLYINNELTTEVELPDGIECVNNAFSEFDGISKIIIPDSVTKITENALYGCNNLIDISIPDSITVVGKNAFYDTGYYNDSDNWQNDILYINGILLTAKTTLTGKITINEGTRIIADDAFNGCVNITEINLPNTLTNIGNYAFYNCTSLQSLTIPDSVINIGEAFSDCHSFDRCTGLKSLNLGKNLIVIAGYAFNNCDSLTEITIPEKLEYLGHYAFGFCDSLTKLNYNAKVCGFAHTSQRSPFYSSPITTIVIGNTVNSLCYNAFCYSSSLKSIIIPTNLTSIAQNAFGYCSNLKDVYFSGNEEDWAKIDIQEYGNSYLTNATIHYNNLPPIEYEYLPPIKISNGGFDFASGKGSANFDYNDYYFKNDADIYNHDLAKMSIRLALSAFATQNVKTQYENAEALLKKLEFINIVHNSWYEKQPERNSIGVIAGRKHIIYPDGNYTLIAVAVRGGGYENEWGGNFNVGSDNHHAGFAAARDQVVKFIKDYINDQRLSGNIKLWITGYSRAAATTNLTAAYFDENPYEAGVCVNLTPDNIYAYCFEAPMGVRNPDNESGLYDNIFSIVNQHDFVPMVAMRKWGYDRYGITKYLPTAQTNDDYIDLRNEMAEHFARYNKSEYIVDDFTYYYTFASNKNLLLNGYGTQGVYLEKTIDKLAENIGSPSDYEKEFQEMFEYIGENIVGLEKTEELANSLLDEMKSRSLLYLVEGTYLVNPATWALASTAYLTTRSAVKAAFKNIGVTASNDAVDTLAGLIIDLGIDNIYTLLKNASGISQGHRPELCMAWLDAIDEDDFSDKRLRTLYLNCPVDMEVYDSNNKLVAAVYDNIPQKIDGSAIVPFIDENGQKIVYLPQDEEYMIEVIATDDGEVTYSMQEQDINTGSRRIVNYNNMAVKKDDTLTGIVENLKTTEIATYPLSSNNVVVSDAEIFEAAEPVMIRTAATGNGIVSNGGKHYKGQFAEVVATPTENEEFLGWYDGEALISSESAYRFQVTKEITLTAKFTENTCEVIFLDDEDDVISIQKIIKGATVAIPKAPQKTGYKFDGFYKDKEYKTAITEDNVYTENTTIYAMYSNPSYTDGFYYFPIDDTTAEIVSCDDTNYELWVPASLDGYIVTKISDSAFKAAKFNTIIIPDTITAIGANAFAGCDYLETVNYIGTVEQWNLITIGESNEALLNADKMFNYIEDIVCGRFDDIYYTSSAVEGTLLFEYTYKNCVAIIEILNYDDEIEEALEIEIPVGTKEKEFSIPLAADDNEHIIQVSFVNNATDKTKLGEGDWCSFYADKVYLTDGDYTYTISRGKAIITSYNGTKTEVEIPEILGEYPVAGIDDYAFEEIAGNCYITSLTLPRSIESISDFALDCLYDLKTISVSDENEYFCVVDNVLFNKNKTRLIKYPAKKIGIQYLIPDTVRTLSACAFANNEYLREAVIPGNVTAINSNAFSGSAIQTITLPASVKDIQEDVFMCCFNLTEIGVDTDNTNYSSEDGVLYNKAKTSIIQYPIGKASSLFVIPNGVETICKYAFLASNLSTIVFPVTISCIEQDAFFRCENLQTILYYGSQEAWQDIEYDHRDNSFDYVDFVYDYNATGLFPYLSDQSYKNELLTLKLSFLSNDTDSVAVINIYDNGENIIKTHNQSIPSGTERISIDIPFEPDNMWHSVEILFVDNISYNNELCDSVQTDFRTLREQFVEGEWEYSIINNKANIVNYLGNSKNVEIPSMLGGYSVVSLGNHAFLQSITENNAIIASLTLPSSIESISVYALDCLYDLKTISVSDENEHFCTVNGVLFNKDKTNLIKYPSSKDEAVYTIPDTVKVISAIVFANTANLTEVNLPASVTDIKEYAFIGSGIHTITIPSNVTCIEDGTFSSCGNLSEINVDSANTEFASIDGVLFNKDKTTLLYYPYGNKITFYQIPDGVRIIASEAFCNEYLQKIQLPNSLETIESEAFSSCDSLNEVIYSGTDEEYQQIDIQHENYPLENAEITFRYKATIDSVNCLYDNNTVTATISFSYLAQEGTLCLALYDEGKLVAVKKKPVTLDEAVNTIEIPGATEAYKNYKAKVFYWDDISSLKPLTEVVEARITEAVLVDNVLESSHP